MDDVTRPDLTLISAGQRLTPVTRRQSDTLLDDPGAYRGGSKKPFSLTPRVDKRLLGMRAFPDLREYTQAFPLVKKPKTPSPAALARRKEVMPPEVIARLRSENRSVSSGGGVNYAKLSLILGVVSVIGGLGYWYWQAHRDDSRFAKYDRPRRSLDPLPTRSKTVQPHALTVAQWQRSINTVLGRHAINEDGALGPKTADAVREIQKAHGLPLTGKLDSQTQALITSLSASFVATGYWWSA